MTVLYQDFGMIALIHLNRNAVIRRLRKQDQNNNSNDFANTIAVTLEDLFERVEF